MLRGFVLTLVLIGLVACADDGVLQESGSQTQDRAGPSLTKVGEFSTVVPGHEEPLIYEPRAVAAHDSLIVVLDSGDPRLAILDRRTGELLHRFGRSGAGPGEIRAGWAAVWLDSQNRIWVGDPGNRRLSAFSIEGELLAEVPVVMPENSGIAAWLGEPGTSHLYVQNSRVASDIPMMRHYLSVLDGETQQLSELLALAEPPPVTGGGSFGSIRFFPRPLWTALPGGRYVSSRTDSAVFEIYDGQTRSLRFTLPLTARELTEMDRRHELEKWQEATGSNRRPTFYTHFPVANRIVAINDSIFGLQHSETAYPKELAAPAANEVVWTLISTAGKVLGQLAFPPEFSPHWVWNGQILGIARDSLGVAAIQEWEVTL